MGLTTFEYAHRQLYDINHLLAPTLCQYSTLYGVNIITFCHYVIKNHLLAYPPPPHVIVITKSFNQFAIVSNYLIL